MLSAKVWNTEGVPQAGAKIFLYKSHNTRKPADFITPVTDGRGYVRLELPEGRYWGVARVKKDSLYGPLMPGDKHSGEPQELESVAGKELTVLFTVADIRDISRKKRSDTTGVVRLHGRVVDSKGMPIANAYLFASRSEVVAEIPEYISAWTDGTGNYSLYLPSGGKYFVGGATRFPMPQKPGQLREVVINDGKLDIAMDMELRAE